MLGELHEAAGRARTPRSARSEPRWRRNGATTTAGHACVRASPRRPPPGQARRAATAPAHHATWGFLTDPAAGGPADLRTEADRDDRIDDGDDATRERRPRAADHPAPAEPEPARAERARARAGNWSTATGAGRRARRLAAEAAAPVGWSDAPLPELGSAPPEPYGASATDRSESRGPGPNGAGQRARPSLPARPGPGCPPVTSGGGTTPCRRPPGSRPCPICRRGHPRPGTAPEAPRRTRTCSPTRRPRAVGYPDASGPLSPIPLSPGMNPGTAGRRWTERPAGWRTAPVRARRRRGGRRAQRREAGRRTRTPAGRWRSARPRRAVH